MPVASKRPFMNQKKLIMRSILRWDSPPKYRGKQIRTKEEFNINPLFMLTKVIKLFGYSYFLRINASIFRRMYFRPFSGRERPPAGSPGLRL